MTLDQLWKLAVAWYADRLGPNPRRYEPGEVREILAEIGLDGPFWDPLGSPSPS